MATTEQPNSTEKGTGGDPFSTLHHMSATAGVGLHDYVAVNTPAVISIAAAAVGLSAFLSPALAVIPLFAMICATIGLVQIQKSNGTQTGRGWAAAGLALSLLIGAVIGWQELAKSRAFDESKEAIGNVFSTFANDTANGDYKAAYALFDPAMQERYPYENFENFFHQVEPAVGRLKALEWNQLLEAGDAQGSEGTELARAVVVFRFIKSPAGISSNVMMVRRSGADKSKGPWMILSMAPPFEKDASKPAKQGATTAPAQPPG